LLGHYAWYTKNSLDKGMLPVGNLKPNDWGLFDMLGNAMEWTQGRSPDSPGSGPARPEADEMDAGDLALINDTVHRVSRGGSFVSPSLNVRSAFRNWISPSVRSRIVGFRPARTVP
jgi:formylglycine-generating enzyme required for sulfatase activity